MTSSMVDRWEVLVGAALLGTDRREPPPPPPGPVADLVADVRNARSSTDVAGALLVEVAALAVARRAGILPGPVVPPPQPPSGDARPVVPPAACELFAHVRGEWPVLEDEWTVTALANGWRIPGDVAVELLRRYRADALRRSRVEALAGPLAAWLVEQLPTLASVARARRDAVDPVALLERPVLPIPPDLAALVDAPVDELVESVIGGFRQGRFGPSHRAVLVNLIVRLEPGRLPALATALAGLAPDLPAAGMAHSLADLARTRADLHAVLAVHEVAT